MTMTPKDLRAFLDANKADIEAEVKRKTIDHLLATHRWQFTDEVAAIVQDFIKTEIAPEVRKHLADNKGPILEAALVGASEIGAGLAKAITENAAKNLTSDGYRFRQVMEAIFKP